MRSSALKLSGKQRHAGSHHTNTKISSGLVVQGVGAVLIACVFLATLLNISNLMSNNSNDATIHSLKGSDSQMRDIPSRDRRSDTAYSPRSICSGNRRNRKAPASSKMKLSFSKRKKFIQGGYEEIAKGSGEMYMAGAFLQLLTQLQHDRLGIYGSIAEIGVHHGRFTGFLYVQAKETEKLVAADLFEEKQNENVDFSGKGDYNKFVEGLNSYGLKESDLYQVIKASSADIATDWYLKEKGGPTKKDEALEGFRLFSVDGGHTAELTLNDLQIAFCNLLTGGIVILDDWFHAGWPGVVEGFYQFVEHEHHQIEPVGTEIYPFLICESKLYLTNSREAHEKYLSNILTHPVMKDWVSLYVKTKKRTGEEAKWPYLMVNGTKYARCNKEKPEEEEVHAVWLDLAQD